MLSIYFGVPGSGKTTHAAMIVKRNLLRGVSTYSNVDIRGAVLYDTAELGVYDMRNADLIIDEASICFNNRNFKALPQVTIQWLKLYRHYGIRNVYVYSQSCDDMDVTLRRLADRLYVVRRSVVPYLHYVKPILVSIGIDEDTHQIVQAYRFGLPVLQTRWFFAPAYWQMFDSWAAPALPDGNFQRVSTPVPVDADAGMLRRLGKSFRWRPVRALVVGAYRLARRLLFTLQTLLASAKRFIVAHAFPLRQRLRSGVARRVPGAERETDGIAD